MHSLSLLSFRNSRPNLLLVKALFLIKLSRTLSLALPVNELQRGEIIAHVLFLTNESGTKVPSQRDEGGTQSSVCDDLVMVCFEQEEHDPGDQRDVPLLKRWSYWSISIDIDHVAKGLGGK